MPEDDFGAKVICDNVHGSIGISRLEQAIINTRTFQRLKKIKQLGLASYVFPGAEHSRFAHSIGAMHVMSLMVDQLKLAGCPYVCSDDTNRVKQKLRLAALLHDIGHYPLAHLGEQAFQWLDEVQNSTTFMESVDDDNSDNDLLRSAATKHESDAAKHERLGELILTHANSELQSILAAAEFDPGEIARIINAEDKDNPFYVQLMSSTLDCDRMDFLLRDSQASGTNFGHVDINYIISNMTWDAINERVCFLPKARNAIEHFVLARYFSYNLTYHKTVMGFELMAKALMYVMMKDTAFDWESTQPIVRSIDDIRNRIADDPEFLANFNDEYFWYYLEHWNPPSESKMLNDLRNSLLSRTPLRAIAEERAFISKGNDSTPEQFRYVSRDLIEQLAMNKDASVLLKDAGVELDRITTVERRIGLEGLPFSRRYNEREPKDEEFLKLIKIHGRDEASDLIADKGSILHVLCNYELRTVRVYALLDKDSEQATVLSNVVTSLVSKHSN